MDIKKQQEDRPTVRSSSESNPNTVFDEIARPKHYNVHKSGVEAIEIDRHMSFPLGNAFKYLFRRKEKGNESKDVSKAIWYLRDCLMAPDFDEETQNDKIIRVTREEPLKIGLAISLIYAADMATCKDAKRSLIQQALSLVESYQQEIEE